MKINITAEANGKEIVENHIIPLLAASKITAEPKDIKVQVVNKDGNLVDVDPSKIKFSYGKV